MYKINEAFKPLYTSKKRYFFITGGRGSLKSTSVHDFITRLTYEVGHGILFTRYTMSSAEKSIIPEFKIVAQRNGSIQDFDITSSKITNRKTGSFILFSGIKTNSGDQTANLKSLAGISTWVIDEGEDFKDEKTFDDIDDSIRTKDKQNRVIWIQNPSTHEHFIYKRWVEPTPKILKIEGYDILTSNNPSVESIHTTYHIAKDLLSDSILEKIAQTRLKDPRKYYHKYLGAWLNKAEGVVFDNWSVGTFNPDGLQTYFGQDYGFSQDPTTLVEVAIDQKNKKIYAKEHLYKKGLSTNQIRDINLAICGNRLIIGDSAEPRLISELQSYLNILPAVKGQGSVNAGVSLLLDYELIIDPNSENLMKELNNYVYADKGSQVFVDAYNHLIDSLRYIVYFMLNKQNSKPDIW